MVTRNVFNEYGFTLLELVFVIVLLAILAAGAVMYWPKGMEAQRDILEVKHALRLAQHMAMTRPHEKAHPWGLLVGPGGHSYSIMKKDTAIFAKDPTGGRDMKDVPLKGSAPLVCDQKGIWFDRFGTPLDHSTLGPITSSFHCSIGGSTITVYPETGYAE